jgi:hypothetical protein
VRRDLGLQFSRCRLVVERGKLALTCGDPVVWKPSEKTPLTAFATEAILRKAMSRFGERLPEGLCSVASFRQKLLGILQRFLDDVSGLLVQRGGVLGHGNRRLRISADQIGRMNLVAGGVFGENPVYPGDVWHGKFWMTIAERFTAVIERLNEQRRVLGRMVHIDAQIYLRPACVLNSGSKSFQRRWRSTT